MEALRIPVALDAVVVRVGALAPGAVTPAAKRCVVSPGQTLKTEALFALKSSVGTLTAVCHDNSFWSRARLRFLADWSVSSPMALGETLTFAVQRLNIYQYWNPLSSDFTEIAVKCIISSWT